MIPYVEGVVYGSSVAAIIYTLVALARVTAFTHRATNPRACAPVTILKPLCGPDPGLYESLRSFCEQNTPHYQVIFGLLDDSEPVAEIVRKLIREYPDRDLSLVQGSNCTGGNRKVSNLVNMYPQAKHDILAVVDSDMRVGRDYVATVAGAFDDPQVGAATCPYKATPYGTGASELGCSYINESFLPSVLVATTKAGPRFCFGSTMAVRRRVLESIGGFDALGCVLADDYMLGHRVAKAGYRVSLVPYLVECIVSEPGLRQLVAHEVRWARTIRSVRPVGHALLFLTYAVPVSSVAIVLAVVTPDFGHWSAAFALTSTAIGSRAALSRAVRQRLGLRSELSWRHLLGRDFLSIVVWGTSFFGRRVTWRGNQLVVHRGGDLEFTENPFP